MPAQSATACWASTASSQPTAPPCTAPLQLLKWLLSRLRQKEADSNKQYASEILAILVQHSGERVVVE